MPGNAAPLVSILTLTYNHERYIRACIESVLGQTYRNWEQIILDDGSRDETANIISSFGDPRIRYVYQSNQGIFRIAESYNRALGLCGGSLIAPLEGDDVWPADKLETLVPAFADPGVVAAGGVCRGISADGVPTPLEIPSTQARKLYGTAAFVNDPVGSLTSAMLHSGITLPSATTALVRRAVLEAIGRFQQLAGLPLMDYPTFLELGLRGKFCFVEKVMCYWRTHDRNASSLLRETIVRGVDRYALEFADQHAGEICLPPAWKKRIRRRWERSEDQRTFSEGSRMLAAGQWKIARARFQVALRSPSLRLRVAAIGGLAASYLRCNRAVAVAGGGSRATVDQDPKTRPAA